MVTIAGRKHERSEALALRHFDIGFPLDERTDTSFMAILSKICFSLAEEPMSKIFKLNHDGKTLYRNTMERSAAYPRVTTFSIACDRLARSSLMFDFHVP